MTARLAWVCQNPEEVELCPDIMACIVEIEHVGSRVTCQPAPKDTDDDWLVLVESIEDIEAAAGRDGWRRGGGSRIPGHESRFMSFTKTNDCINLIATEDRDFYRRFVAATRVAKRLNLQNKSDRIALFQAVLYGNPCD